MGDRCNVFVKEAGVYLYGHWSGYRIAQIVRDALKRGEERWGDAPYLARIVFQQMLGDDRDLTGFGISSTIGDNERPIIVLDTDTQVAAVTSDRAGESNVGKLSRPVAFADLVKMTDAQVRTWHLGEGDES